FFIILLLLLLLLLFLMLLSLLSLLPLLPLLMNLGMIANVIFGTIGHFILNLDDQFEYKEVVRE
ncbi:hypothetical protein J3Q64DRAFT_1779175, partial [Phycomyces blakesleeanus]